MKSGSRVLISMLALLGGIMVAGPVLAQTRTITTDGTSTGGGTVKITIEDFNKPERRDLTPDALSPQAIIYVEVLIQSGWNCEQTTQAILNALLSALPDGYILTVTTRNPCTILIGCKKDAQCNGWEFTQFEENVPGQNIVPADVGVPTEPVTWGSVKARYLSTP